MTADEASCSSVWTKEQDKAFENALATHPEDDLDRWQKITADVNGKTLEEIKYHYELLVEDVNQIETGCVPLPDYSPSEGSTGHTGEEGTNKKGGHSEHAHGNKVPRSDQERRKGIAWSEDEHRLFLLGLDKYGKGDWRSISRNYVVTRTPTQVASHAQKYFIRLNSMNRERRRSSIHDITSVGNEDISAPQGPMIGQTNGSAGGDSSGKASKQPPQRPAESQAVRVYASPTIGQPIGGPLVSAMGTPVNLPGPGHMGYGVQAPVPGAVVPGAPRSVGAMTYPTPPTTTPR